MKQNQMRERDKKTEENTILKSSYIFYIVDFSKETIVFVFNACGVYFFWIGIHYLSAHLYTHFCTPKTVLGFLLSPLLVPSPQCKAIRWLLFNGSNVIDNMWLLLGTWVCSKLLFSKKAASVIPEVQE